MVSKKTEFYQIELLEILLPVGKKYLWYLWQIWKCSIRQNSVFFQTPCIYSNISILIVKSFKERESLTYHELLTAWRKKITRQLVLEMDASKILNRQGAKEKKNENINRCSQSGFAYLRAIDLRAHWKTHAGEKSHKCEFASIMWFKELLRVKGCMCTICFYLRNNGKFWGFET